MDPPEDQSLTDCFFQKIDIHSVDVLTRDRFQEPISEIEIMNDIKDMQISLTIAVLCGDTDQTSHWDLMVFQLNYI